MKIVVGFSKTRSIPSKLIRWFLGTSFSHCYIRLWDPFWKTEQIFHSDFPGVVLTNAKIFEKENFPIEEFEVDDEKLLESLRKNYNLLGTKYDYSALFGWGWTIAFQKWIKKKIEKPFDDPKEILCVEFVIKVLNDAKIVHLPNGTLNPKTFFEWVKENHEVLGWKHVRKNGVKGDNS